MVRAHHAGRRWAAAGVVERGRFEIVALEFEVQESGAEESEVEESGAEESGADEFGVDESGAEAPAPV